MWVPKRQPRYSRLTDQHDRHCNERSPSAIEIGCLKPGMHDLPSWKSVGRHLRVKWRIRQPSVDRPRTPSDNFQETILKGISTRYEISRNGETLPAPKTSLEQGLSIGILDLPRELRDHLISYLPPSSAVALKLSCRTLYHSGPALPILSYLARKNPESRYEWTLMQERLGRYDGKLVCSGCKIPHDVWFFTLEERRKKAEDRLCTGRGRVLYLTPNRFIPFCHFEKISRHLLRDKRYFTYAYGWFCYHQNGRLYELPPSAADIARFPVQGHYHWTKHSKGLISMSAYLTVRMESVDAKAQTCASISLELQKFPFTLCRHIKSSTRILAKAVHEAQRRRMCETNKRRRVYVQCSYCDCKPRLEVNNACKALVIYARRSVGRGSATAPEWLEQAEDIPPSDLWDSIHEQERFDADDDQYLEI